MPALASDTLRQSISSSARAPSGPALARPEAKATAFMAPAEVAEMADMLRLFSSLSRSSTPHV
jgi:hypothetical protein